jgi:hypothetical protein
MSASGLKISADRSCRSGEQLFEDYGDNEDGIYLQYHGFVASNNPFRCVNFEVDYAKDLSLRPERVKSVLKKLKLNGNIKRCVDSTGDLGLGIIVYLAVINFSPAELAECEAVISTSNNDWDKVALECGFVEVQSAIQEYLAGATVLLPEKMLKGNTASRSDGHETFSLFGRILSTISDRIDSYARSFPTSLYQDEIRVQQLSAVSVKNSSKLQLSLQYRLAVKRHWKLLCCLYSADCCSSTVEYDVIDKNDQKDVHIDNAQKNKVLNAGNDNESKFSKVSTDESLDHLVQEFMLWFNAAQPFGNKLKAAVIPGFRLGTLATEAISAGDIYSSVPVQIIMDADKALTTTYRIRYAFHV